MIELLRTRRSIRAFRDAPLSPEQRAALEEALLRSPSSRSLDPWEFVLVDDRELLAQLARCKPHGASFLARAPLGIVVCGNEQKSDVWIEDCAIATTLAHLTAHALGLGSCWIQVRLRPHDEAQSAEAYIQRLLGIPAHLRVLAMLAVGPPAEDKPGHGEERMEQAKLHRNRY